jgi:NitT/TauT family transport system ATP-binding protein
MIDEIQHGPGAPGGADPAGGPAPKIRLDGVRREFFSGGRKVVAVDDVSLDVRPGEFLVIVGPSGCGKSTLLRMLADLDAPTEGSVTVAQSGTDRPKTSMVFQGDSIFPWMTVRDNAGYGLKMRGVDREEARATVDAFLETTGLLEFADAYPHQLSGGMRQRVSLARAFANDPEVLLMDEPFSALDEQNKTLLQQELLRIWEATAKTVVFITHSVDEAVTLGDRVLVMTARPGRTKAIVDVPFERPRDVLELRARPEYGALVHEIWGALRDEVDAARRVEVAR